MEISLGYRVSPEETIWLSLPVSENFAEQNIFYLKDFMDPFIPVQF